MDSRTAPGRRGKRAGSLALLLLLVPLGWWGFGPPGGASMTQPEGGTAVSIVDFAFQPATVNIAVGDTVTWTNNGAFNHTSTGDGSAWHSGTLVPGGSFPFTFNSAGAFSYFCAIHPGMTGTVNVSGGGTPATATGTATRTATPTATSTATSTATATATNATPGTPTATRTVTATATGTAGPTAESEVWLPLTVKEGDE